MGTKHLPLKDRANGKIYSIPKADKKIGSSPDSGDAIYLYHQKVKPLLNPVSYISKKFLHLNK